MRKLATNVSDGKQKESANPIPLLEIQNLYKAFPVKGGLFLRTQRQISVIYGISQTIHAGEVVGIVGESGCGKSTLARLIMRIYPESAGQILLKQQRISSLPAKHFYQSVQMVFQDPYSSLNPKFRVRFLLQEMLRLHQSHISPAAATKQLLTEVGLSPQVQHQYPHEFSGGQRQRIAIARALAADPELLIADEPVSALDVSIQAQILQLLQELQKKKKLTLLFISHDLVIVDSLCDRIWVMYLGQIVEELPGHHLEQAVHPYTKILLASIPSIKKRKSGLPILPGEPASPSNRPMGCAFHPRCPYRMHQCKLEIPKLKPISATQRVACHAIR